MLWFFAFGFVLGFILGFILGFFFVFLLRREDDRN
jgi:NhaP-type Na+/H+ or K+/H+ antiporter